MTTARPGPQTASPVVGGLLAAVITLGAALALSVVPALAAQLAATRSSMTTLDAVLLGLNALVLGHGGSLLLEAGAIRGAVSLMPMGFTALLVLCGGLAMRRAARSLHLTSADGSLRPRALRDLGLAIGAFVVLYAVGIGVLAGMARTPVVHPVVPSAVVSAALVALLGGIGGSLAALRRQGTGAVPGVRILDLVPAAYGALLRALGVALLGLLGAGLVIVAAMIALRAGTVLTLHGQLEPGIVGGILLVLLQLALLPLLAVWGMVVLLGGTVGIGASTSVALSGTSTGVLPALPLLGIVPSPGEGPWWAWLLVALPAAAVALGARRLVRDLDGPAGSAADRPGADARLGAGTFSERAQGRISPRERLIVMIAYPLVLIVLVLVLAALASGGIGTDALQHLGPKVGTLVVPASLLVIAVSALTLSVLATPFLPWTRAQAARLREKVEEAERQENGAAGRSAASAGSPQDGSSTAVSPTAAGSQTPADSPTATATAGSPSTADSPSATRTSSSPSEPGGISPR